MQLSLVNIYHQGISYIKYVAYLVIDGQGQFAHADVIRLWHTQLLSDNGANRGHDVDRFCRLSYKVREPSALDEALELGARPGKCMVLVDHCGFELGSRAACGYAKCFSKCDLAK